MSHETIHSLLKLASQSSDVEFGSKGFNIFLQEAYMFVNLDKKRVEVFGSTGIKGVACFAEFERSLEIIATFGNRAATSSSCPVIDAWAIIY